MLTTAKNHIDRSYIEGDIQLRKYCGGDGGCLKTVGETNKHPLFRAT